MAIKELTRQYLDTLNGISQSDKEKIANFNANSEWILFSASSLDLGGFGSTNYHGIGESWKDCGAPKRVDGDGFLLVDLAEYSPWYTSPELLSRRDPSNERFNLDNIHYRRRG